MVVEQVIRPTGLIDPEVEVRPVGAPGRRPARARSASASATSERVLVTTLTKRMAEDLTEYYAELGVQGALPALATSTRSSASRSSATCACGEFDVLVGINLLREGLDMPEVSLVAILDADKEGFLRSRALADPDHRPRRAQRATAR